MDTRERVHIFDTTLRDGEQAPGCSMHLDEKLRLARKLERLGVDVIEAGFPIASDGDFDAVAAVAHECRSVTVAALCRTSEGDIVRAAEALEGAAHPRIHTFIATSDIHLEFKLGKTRPEVLDAARRAVRIARRYVDEVEFSAEDATRSDVGFLCDVFDAVAEEGATILNVPDTVGYTTPGEYGELIRTVIDRVVAGRPIQVSAHCHNDLGLAVANSLAAASAGARQIECTINGIGERAGNAALEEIVAAMQVRRDRLPFATGIDATQLYAASCLVAEVVGFGVQPNKAIVGRNAFAHEAGIHQHGVLKNPLCYEILTPESVGVPSNAIVLGKHSGRHALALRYAELGYTVASTDLDRIYHRFTALADRKKRIFDQDLISLIAADRDGSSRALVGIRA
ncbi:MAG: 2-isopropylmalate synthase [Blastocatellia bacterium]|nr:2-isopropylmalate synthase [Blastocatellia bacterium]